MAKTVLIVDDEPAIRQVLSFTLSGEGYELFEAADADAALAVIEQARPDLILLDWMLPGLSGLDLARRLRRDSKTKDIAIIMLTARGEEEDCVRGLDSGADDFITKPFSSRELSARVRAIIRRLRPAAEQSSELQAGPLTLNAETKRVTCDSRTLALSSTEFQLLHFLMSHPERVYTRSQLLDGVWGENTYIEDRTVDVHIRRLRVILEPHHCDVFVQTVRGVGYRFSTRLG